jgi:hypothetical protein
MWSLCDCVPLDSQIPFFPLFIYWPPENILEVGSRGFSLESRTPFLLGIHACRKYMEGLTEGHRREKNHCEWVTARNFETVALIRPNFRKRQQPTQILELNVRYYFQSAAVKVRIWNEVHHRDPRQSVSVHSE